MADAAEITIRYARDGDFAALWPILRGVIRAGDTYTIEPGLTREAVRALWMQTPRATCVAEIAGEVLGTYYLKTNQPGGGAHVCNCGYVVAPSARGRGIARAMCLHSQTRRARWAISRCSSISWSRPNRDAIALWEALGFETVGRLPRAFQHPTEGLVDARVMYKWLGE